MKPCPEKETLLMSATIAGVVRNGVIIPNTPLPEGAHVEIRLNDKPPEVSPELQEEFDAWDRASADALDLVERLAQETDSHEKRWRVAGPHPPGAGARADRRTSGHHSAGRPLHPVIADRLDRSVH